MLPSFTHQDHQDQWVQNMCFKYMYISMYMYLFICLFVYFILCSDQFDVHVLEHHLTEPF